MIDRKARALAAAAAALVLFIALALTPALRADHNSISGTDQLQVITAQPIAASGTFTQAKPFTALGRSITQSVQIRGVGTAPNYKAEMLVSVDGVTYVKPEVGGDLGTFTDQNWHALAVSTPLCEGHEIKITELGGANTITIDAWERSQ